MRHDPWRPLAFAVAALTVAVVLAAPAAADGVTATTDPALLTAENLDGATVTLTLASGAFVDPVDRDAWSLLDAPPGATIAAVERVSDGAVVLTLAYDGAPFDGDAPLRIGIAGAAFVGDPTLPDASVDVGSVAGAATPTPTPTPTATATPAPTPTATPTPSPTPTTEPAGPPLDGAVFNGDFEAAASPDGWTQHGGTLEIRDEPAGRVAALVSTTTSTKWIEQPVRIAAAGGTYALAATVTSDAGVDSAWLRIAWYTSDDGSGSQLATTDSATLDGAGTARLDTGAQPAPDGARSARVRIVLRPVAADEAVLLIDDVVFSTAAPAPEPTPEATPAPAATAEPTPAPTAAATPAPTAEPTATATPAATETPEPTPTPTPVPTATPAPGPPLVDAVFNGGFEDPADLAGWSAHAVDAAIVASGDGGRAAGLTANSASTGWIDQLVLVAPGAWYEARASLVPGDGADSAWVRLAWYATDDGSGGQLSTDDSAPIAPGDAAGANTGAVQAPDGAHSVRVRVMLRPTGDALATLTVDDVAIDAVDAPPPPPPDPVAPVLLAAVFNGGFEDPTPLLGWSAHGATATLVEREDGHAAELASAGGSSTKWLDTVVGVEPGRWYAAAGFLAPDATADSAWVRIAWYGTPDGRGGQLATDDSPTVPGGAAAPVSTGPAQAPDGALSARVRLMLRPRGDAPATLTADDVSIVETAEPPPPPPKPKKPSKQAAPEVDTPILDGALYNADFAADVGLDGWSRHGGTLDLRAAPDGGGQVAVLTSTSTSAKWMEQTVGVRPGAWYAAGASLQPGDGVASAWVRVAWYASDDASGSQLSTADSPPLEDGAIAGVATSTVRVARLVTAGFASVTTGAVQAPDEAHSARLRIVLKPRGASPAELLIASASFASAAAPSHETTATAPASDARPAAAPVLFETIFNGGFDFDGDLTGWSHHGGVAAAGPPSSVTGRVAALRSDSASTKWLEQRVRVSPGARYRVSARLAPDRGAATAWVRVAWYASTDASGSQLKADDSDAIDGGAGATVSSFEVDAPDGAQSARVRLMLRPLGSRAATLLIDDVRLERVARPPATPAPTPAPEPAHAERVSASASSAEALRLAPARLAADQRALRITELLPNPEQPGSDNDYEWIEITNLGAAPAPLAGAVLADNRGAVTFPDLVLPPGASLLVAGARAAVANVLAYYPPGGFSNGLSNGGDRLELTAADGTRLDALSYGSDRTFDREDVDHVGAPAAGKSIERRFDATGVLVDAAILDAPTPGHADIERVESSPALPPYLAPSASLLPATPQATGTARAARTTVTAAATLVPVVPASALAQPPEPVLISGARSNRATWIAIAAVGAVAAAFAAVRYRRRAP